MKIEREVEIEKTETGFIVYLTTIKLNAEGEEILTRRKIAIGENNIYCDFFDWCSEQFEQAKIAEEFVNEIEDKTDKSVKESKYTCPFCSENRKKKFKKIKEKKDLKELDHRKYRIILNHLKKSIYVVKCKSCGNHFHNNVFTKKVK